MIEENTGQIPCLGTNRCAQQLLLLQHICYIIGYYIVEPIILYHFMDSFLGVPLEAITTPGNKLLRLEGVIGDFSISISGKKLSSDRFHYIIYVELCGYPERWWNGSRFKIAEASGENIKILEIEILRQLKRLHLKL